MAKYGGYGGGMGNMNMQQMMKQAQKMQEQLRKAQEELEETELDGESGGGLVTVTLNGKKKLLKVSIKPEALSDDDPEMIEDLIMAAYEQAYEKADELEAELMPVSF